MDGLAAFTIVDPAVPYCAADEGCPTPWDYCCQQDKVPANSATVKLVDADGKLVAEGARDLLGVEELAEVVVRGKAERTTPATSPCWPNGCSCGSDRPSFLRAGRLASPAHLFLDSPAR